MPFIKNTNYDPSNPQSKRFIQALDNSPFSSILKTPQPKQNVEVRKPTIAPTTTATSVLTAPISTTSKTSTPSGISSLVAPITPSTVPTVPTVPSASAGVHTVVSGDTLGAIAAKNGTTVAELQALNPQITDPNLIQPGQTFKLPGAATTTPIQPPNIPVQTPATPPTTPAPTTAIAPPITGNVEVDNSIKTLATQAGKAGMTVTEYLDLVQRSEAPTKAESDAIRNNLGIPDLIDDVFAKPKQTTVQQYQELYTLSGIKEIKERVKEFDANIAQKRKDLVKATGDLYNNPWLSQSTRQGRLKNLQDLAFADIANVIEQKKQALSLYDDGITEIEEAIKRSVFDVGADRDLTVEKLNFLLTEAERDEVFAQRAVEQRGIRNIPDFLSARPEAEAEGFTLGKDQQRFDAQGNLIASNVGGTTEDDFMNKKLSPKEAADLGLPVGSTFADAAIKQTENKVDATTDVVSLIDSIINDPALSALTGPLGSKLPSFKTLTGQTGDLNRMVDRLANLITIENLDLMSGVLSETDIKILKEGGTLINKSQRKGNFVKELERLQGNALKEQYRMLGITDVTYQDAVDEYGQEAVREVIDKGLKQLLLQPANSGFSNESQTSQNGSSVLALGEITGFGSPLWEHGLDIDLKIGDPVPSPVSGKVVFAGNNGGFGNQVQIEASDGKKYWLSHLDSHDVSVGQSIQAGQTIGKGGNSGKTIPGPNGDGSHLDLTVKNPDGSFMNPRDIFRRLKTLS